MSKIVMGALTAAAWFALSYAAARAESIAGHAYVQTKYVCANAGHANSGAAVNRPIIALAR